MTVRWDLLLIPSFLFTFILLSVSQTLFLEGSFYKDLGLGRTGDTLRGSFWLRWILGSPMSWSTRSTDRSGDWVTAPAASPHRPRSGLALLSARPSPSVWIC